MKTPILFLIFNRPEPTGRVFEEIRRAKPEKLFIAADGPRECKEGEAKLCAEARKITEQVDWDCEVKTLFRDKNLGCKIAVSSAITWFFDNVEEGIILEDDCLPNQSFFEFCEILLNDHRNQPEIMHIGANNFQNGIKRGDGSYYFSKYTLIWGWATWRRAWKNYDIDMKLLDDFFASDQFLNVCPDKREQNYWKKKFTETKKGIINTWDYQWLYSCWLQEGMAVIPQVNLVTNIGFGENATHTQGHSSLANTPLNEIRKIKHPTKIKINHNADNYIFKNIYSPSSPTLINKLKAYFLSMVPSKVKIKIKQYWS